MFLYILKSRKDNSYYIGITKDLENRILKHNKGKVLYTKPKRPWILVYKKQYTTRSEALREEKHLKSLKSRKAIEKIIQAAFV